MKLRWRAVLGTLLMALSLPASAHERVEGEPRDVDLTDSSGQAVQLSSFRGKPLVVFYEDRQSVEANRPLKLKLWERGTERNLRSAAHVVAVTDLRAYDFFPMRPIALSYVRDEEKRVGVPILVDLTGRLNSAPWELPEKVPSVVVLDGEGRVKFLHSGRMPTSEYDLFFKTLGELVGVDLLSEKK